MSGLVSNNGAGLGINVTDGVGNSRPSRPQSAITRYPPRPATPPGIMGDCARESYRAWLGKAPIIGAGGLVLRLSGYQEGGGLSDQDEQCVEPSLAIKVGCEGESDRRQSDEANASALSL